MVQGVQTNQVCFLFFHFHGDYLIGIKTKLADSHIILNFKLTRAMIYSFV